MYELNDTITAVSSPVPEQRVIIRITGPRTIDPLHGIFRPAIPKDKAGIISGRLLVDADLEIDAALYMFPAPHSYTGETLVEIHIHTNASVTEALMSRLLAEGLRMAGPGEFTARSFLNDKIDLAQAEAVNEIIISSNKFQLAAAEKLLAGKLAESCEKIQASIIDCLGSIEAGMDFTEHDIEFITSAGAIEKLNGIKNELEELLSGSIRYESVIDLPSVGIAAAPNAGKSSLLNRLLGRERSIVSEQRKTTRDVLTGILTLEHCRCVLFDCAGLILKPHGILDELVQSAAAEALRNAPIVLFCVDISKSDWSEDTAIHRLIEPEIVIPVATKADLLSEHELSERLHELNVLFSADFLATSAENGMGISTLQEMLDKRIIETTLAGASGVPASADSPAASVALTARHKQAVTEAIENIGESLGQLHAGNDEVVAMLLRTAIQRISAIETESIDEQVLDNIFKRFCIGK